MILQVALLLFVAAAAPARATDFTLSVTTSGPLNQIAAVTSAPAGIACPGDCSADFAEDTEVTLTQVTPSTMAFASWAGTGGCKTNAKTCKVTMSAPVAVTAKFNPRLDLSILGSGVGVVTSSGGVSCSSTGTCANGATMSMTFPQATVVVLTYSTSTQSAFVGWTSSAGGCATASTCTVTLNSYVHVVATFTASAAAYDLAVAIPNGGGTVTSAPAGILCPGVCKSTFTASASVKLTTAAASGYRFAGWANGGCSGINTCVVTSTSPLQGFGGRFSPAAYFFKNP